MYLAFEMWHVFLRFSFGYRTCLLFKHIKQAPILPKKTRFSEEPIQQLKKQIHISAFPRRCYLVYENGLQRCILIFFHLLLHFFLTALPFPHYFHIVQVFSHCVRSSFTHTFKRKHVG